MCWFSREQMDESFPDGSHLANTPNAKTQAGSQGASSWAPVSCTPLGGWKGHLGDQPALFHASPDVSQCPQVGPSV